MPENIKDIIEKAAIRNFVCMQRKFDGASFRKGFLTVIYSIGLELDNKRWLHVSLARPNKYPPYEEIKLVKDIFIGDEKAIMVFPKKENFVNIHKYCFHLWRCLDGDTYPDFDRGMGTI